MDDTERLFKAIVFITMAERELEACSDESLKDYLSLLERLVSLMGEDYALRTETQH